MIKNILKVLIGNIFILASGLLAGFLLPKILGIQNYGFYKAFSLYCTYAPIFHLGFIDGIYLKYGGIRKKDINGEKFKTITSSLLFLEILLALPLLLIAIIIAKSEYIIISTSVIINIIIINLTTYYQVLSQISKNFDELKNRNIIKSILQIISLVILYAIYEKTKTNISYYCYIFIYTLIGIIMLIWYSYTYKRIQCAPNVTQIIKNKKQIIEYCKIGLPLTLSNIVSILILSLDRQFVNLLFETVDFSIYSFAYTIITLITTLVASASTVLYPYLKTNSGLMNEKNYEMATAKLLISTTALSILYFIMKEIIIGFLPEYSKSTDILVIMIPSVCISSAISIICHNYYKAMNRSRQFFYYSIMAITISFVLNILAYTITKDMLWISIASLITYLVWYIIVDIAIYKNNTKWVTKIMKYIYLLCISSSFIILAKGTDASISNSLIYIAVFAVGSILYYQMIRRQKWIKSA